MTSPVGAAAEHPKGWDSAASQSARNKRRILGMLAKRLNDARLSEVSDGRDLRGRRWRLETLLSSVLLGLVSTNEMGVFGRVLDQVMAAYSKSELFRLVTYDAGACSMDNARAVRKHGLHYLLGLKGTQSTLHEDAKLWLGVRGAQQADAVSEDLHHGNVVVRRLYLGEAVAAPVGWEHLRTVARVEVETLDTKGNRISREDRYFVSSLPRSRLTDEQWLLLVRRHWGVETAHQILDGAFDEDKHPWIEQHPRATAVVMVLRRIAYTLLVLWRDVTLRSDDNRSRPWSWIMRDIFLCLLTATAERLRNQRSMPLLT